MRSRRAPARLVPVGRDAFLAIRNRPDGAVHQGRTEPLAKLEPRCRNRRSIALSRSRLSNRRAAHRFHLHPERAGQALGCCGNVSRNRPRRPDRVVRLPISEPAEPGCAGDRPARASAIVSRLARRCLLAHPSPATGAEAGATVGECMPLAGIDDTSAPKPLHCGPAKRGTVTNPPVSLFSLDRYYRAGSCYRVRPKPASQRRFIKP